MEHSQRGHSWPIYVLLVLGLTGILAGVGWQALRDRAAVRPAAPGQAMLGLPVQLWDKPATQIEVGQAALQTIQSMHGKGFALTAAAVAHYGSAAVWVAQTKDEPSAIAMTAQMTAKITGGNSPFSPTGARRANGRTIYALTGMGQTHFYWQTGDKVIWLAIDPGQADAGLDQLMRAIDERGGASFGR